MGAVLPPGFDAQIDAYLAYLTAQRRASAHTLNAYRRELRRLATLADGAAPEAIDTARIRRLAATLHAGG